MKACTSCRRVLPMEAFRAFINRHGKTYRRNMCIECVLERQRPKSAEWYSANKSRRAISKREWQRKNKSRVNHYVCMRYANRISATPKWADETVISEVYELAELRTRLTGIKWEVDHIVPLQHPLVCGLHVEKNLRVIPLQENRVKGNRFWPGMPVDIDLSERTVLMT